MDDGDDGSRHGPEPEVITLKARGDPDSDDEEVYTKGGGTNGVVVPIESRHRAALVKATVAATACCFFLLIYLTSYFAMDPGGLGSLNGNTKTSIKVGRILGMQDTRYARAPLSPPHTHLFPSLPLRKAS